MLFQVKYVNLGLVEIRALSPQILNPALLHFNWFNDFALATHLYSLSTFIRIPRGITYINSKIPPSPPIGIFTQ